MTQTLGDVLTEAARALRAAGIVDPRREARLLAQHGLGLSASEVITRERDEVGRGDDYQRFQVMVTRRAARVPLQHILGTVEFFGLELLSDARALIPRPDSEVVVEAALDMLPENFSGVIADLGTGSGCLLLACLSQRSHARGIGIDASADAIRLAQENAARTGLGERSEFLHTDWVNWTGWADADLIISNPPYIETEIICSLQIEVREHDPISALDGGDDGLAAYRAIFASAENMNPTTSLVLEIGYDQSESVPILAERHGFELKSLKRDLGGNPRALTFQQGIRK